MPTAKITEMVVTRAKARDREMFIWDIALRGFGVRVTRAGTKTYVFQYRLGGGNLRHDGSRLVSMDRLGPLPMHARRLRTGSDGCAQAGSDGNRSATQARCP